MRALLLALAIAAAPALAAPDEEALGKAEGYPVCDVSQLGAEQRCLVGTLSHFDRSLASRKVAKASEPRPLRRAGAELKGAAQFMAANRNTGLLVLRGDTIHAERYNYERRPETRFQSFSMAKTVVALLVGIALEEKKIGSIDDLAEMYVPELKGQPYGQTSLRHLLTMSSGVEFSERYDGRDDVSKLARKSLYGLGPGGADTMREFTRRERPPGQKFMYASGDTQVLSLVLRAAVGRNLSEYLAEKIWIPMGAEAEATWQIDGGGYETGYIGLNATLRDWGRLGLLLADGGAREGRQIIPAAWVKEMASLHGPHLAVGTAAPRNGYGYQTWLIDNQGKFALLGVRGQAVMVDAKTRTVVVHTAVHSSPWGDRGPQFRFFFETLRALQ